MKKKFIILGLCLSVFTISGGLYYASNQEENSVDEDVKIGNSMDMFINKEINLEDATSSFDETSTVVFESDNKKIFQDSRGNELVLKGDISKFPKDLQVYGFVSDPSQKEVIEIHSDDLVE